MNLWNVLLLLFEAVLLHLDVLIWVKKQEVTYYPYNPFSGNGHLCYIVYDRHIGALRL